jgi:hypothetical protein
MGVLQDYMGQNWGRYFTENFRKKHLRPFHYIPVKGHKEARQRAREGNIALNQRFQREQDTDWNSLIFDIDPEAKARRQVLQLMKEVERRNEEKFYKSDEARARPIMTLDAYYIQTTGHGSRQSFVCKPFTYGVVKDEDTGRYVINHFGGT